MKINSLSLALACLLPTTTLFAAAMDRSGQSISSFLQPNNYAEIGVSILDANVEGVQDDPKYPKKHIDDMADSYMFGSAAFKMQVNDKFSVGLIYDQPFGAKATYNGDNFLVSKPGDRILGEPELTGLKLAQTEQRFAALSDEVRVGMALSGSDQPAAIGAALSTPAGQATLAAYKDPTNPAHTPTKESIDNGIRATISDRVNQAINSMELGEGGTKVDVTTQNYSLIFGYKPIENFTIYGGPVYQLAKGSLNLRGERASVFNGYNANFKESGDIGWLAGVAYEIPEIALKASLTYRSKIEHELETDETWSTGQLGGLGLLGIALTPGKTLIETPQSVNLDFQTGIMANTVAFANIRWVDWDSFGVRPAEFGQVATAVAPMIGRTSGFDVIKYSEDQWSINAGLGRKFNDKWAGTASVGWDSGAGNPVSSLGPTEGYTNVGIGLQYSPAPHYFVGAGVKYFWLGDADAQISSQAGTDGHVAKFEDNTAIAYGLKMGYRF